MVCATSTSSTCQKFHLTTNALIITAMSTIPTHTAEGLGAWHRLTQATPHSLASPENAQRHARNINEPCRHVRQQA